MTDNKESTRKTNRRRFLKGVGAVSTLGIAGCGGDGDTDPPGETAGTNTGTTGPTETRTEGTTPTATETTPESGDPPNIVFIMADDMGYGDTSVEPFVGEETYPTPNLDRMATNGGRFTSHYCDAPRCTPTRASFMTGCYPPRSGVSEALAEEDEVVITEWNEVGLDPALTTVADSLGQQGYTTGCVGKWHLGTDDPFLPPNQGFDYSYGVPHSNDMRPFYMKSGLEVVDGAPVNSTLTKRFTERATGFIRDNAGDPFFLYLPHSMSHLPLGTSEEFEGVTDTKFGDVMHELDWSVGQILDTLEELGLSENTLVVFTTDDGTWLEAFGFRDITEGDVGNEEPVRESKNSDAGYEGGFRVPMIAQWPETIPAGTRCDEITAHIDMLPTFAEIADAPLPEYDIDGRSIVDMLADPESASSPHDYYYYYAERHTDTLQAIRNAEGDKLIRDKGELYDLNEDLGEQDDISGSNPDIVEELNAQATTFDDALRDGAREPGRLSSIAYATVSTDGDPAVTVINNSNEDVVVGDLTVRAPHVDWTVEAEFSPRIAGPELSFDFDLTSPDGDLTEEVYLEASVTLEGDDEETVMKTGETINGGPDRSGGVIIDGTPRT